MSINKSTLFFLCFIPPLFFSWDFYPSWLIYYQASLLSILSVTRIPRLCAYLNFYMIYELFTRLGFELTPETTIPGLSIFITSQLILNRYEKKLEYYTLFLFIGSLAVFNTSLYYFLYTLLSIFLVFYIESKDSKIGFKLILSNIWYYKIHIFFGVCITSLLFLFFPRYYGFLPTTPKAQKGVVGYSTKIDNTDAFDLSLSNKIVFYAEVPNQLPQEKLYWRGRTLNMTDGYNWKQTNIKHTSYKRQNYSDEILYKINYEENFEGDVILLDTPIYVNLHKNKIYEQPEFNDYKTYFKTKKLSYRAKSSFNTSLSLKGDREQLSPFLQLPKYMATSFKDFREHVKAKTPIKIIENFSDKIKKEKFEYTLNPGKMPTLEDFLQNKKGFCTHFASLMALTLRSFEIPARVVSGFQGGEYNELGSYYTIKSRDAHAWVEYYSQNRWNRVDPTEFIAINRIQLGGFSLTSLDEKQQKDGVLENSILGKVYNELAKRVSFINYKFSLFLENFNREEQRNISFSLGIKAKYFFGLGLIFALFFVFGFYYFFLKKKRINLHPADRMIIKLEKKLKLKNHELLHAKTINHKALIISKITTENWPLEFLDQYQEYRFAGLNKKEQLDSILKNNTL